MHLWHGTGPKSSLAVALDAAHCAAFDVDHWPAALEAAADYVGGDGGLLVHHDFARHEHEIAVGRLSPELSGVYIERHAASPLTVGSLRLPPGLHVASHFADMKAVQKSEFGQDILRPQRIADLLMFSHAPWLSPGTTGGIAITLNARQAEHASPAIRRFARLAPHLARSLDTARATARARQLQQLTNGLLDAMSCAAIVVGRSGRALAMNRAAEHLVKRGDLLTLRGPGSGRLFAVAANHDARLRGAIAAAVSSRADQQAIGTSLRLTSPAGSGAIIVLTPMGSDLASLWLGIADSPAALIRVIGNQNETAGQAAIRLGTVFGLTKAEVRIVECLCAVDSIPAAARQLGLTTETVRTHLNHVFNKTGVRSQIALARMIERLRMN